MMEINVEAYRCCCRANNEIDRIIKQHENDTLALRLKVKQLESKNETLTISVEAKVGSLKCMPFL